MFLMRTYHAEEDFWDIRNFLREVFMLNNRLEYAWHVARFDYWRWHGIITCQATPPVSEVTTMWETQEGKIIGVLHPISANEIRVHIHPHYRTRELEDAIMQQATNTCMHKLQNGRRVLYLPVIADDAVTQAMVLRHGYKHVSGWGHHWRRDLDSALPHAHPAPGYQIRSMGGVEDYPARSLASWYAFHADEPEDHYDHDWSWYANLQSAPLYRRDLDIVASTEHGDIAAFCTIFYDDVTRSAVYVLVGTTNKYWRLGLGKAVMVEGMRRLQKMGCTRIFATAHEEAANFLYQSVMQEMILTDTWLLEKSPGEVSG